MMVNTATYYEETKLGKLRKPTPFKAIVPLKEHCIFQNCNKIFEMFFGNFQIGPNDP